MPLRVAQLCSAHGLGHLTRQLVLAEGLRAVGAVPVVYTAAPAVARAYQPWLRVEPWSIDVGIVQRDGLAEDIPATLTALDERCSDAAIDGLAAALEGYDLAVVDVAPVALEAARRAGIPAVAVGNFDWAWIYARTPGLEPWSERFAAWQAPHPAIQLEPGPGVFGFASVERWGVLGRQRPAWTPPWPERTALVALGPAWQAQLALPTISGLRWLAEPPRGVPYPAIVAGMDLVLTKPGYGIYAECALAGTPIVWLRRPGFPEAPFLEAAMERRGDLAVDGTLARAVDERLARGRPAAVQGVHSAMLAGRVLAQVRTGG